jgi:environmental stress-induced protein Ves
MQILHCRDLIAAPWKNGGGITREIATGVAAGRTVWRISRADVTHDGPFSDFAGFTRILTVVQGGALRLEHAQGTLTASHRVPLRFDGGLAVQARLTGGPVTNLNLIFDPLRCTADVTLRHGPCALTRAQGVLAYHVVSGKPQISGTPLSPGDTVFPDADTLVMAHGDAVLDITLRCPPQSAAITLCIAVR